MVVVRKMIIDTINRFLLGHMQYITEQYQFQFLLHHKILIIINS